MVGALVLLTITALLFVFIANKMVLIDRHDLKASIDKAVSKFSRREDSCAVSIGIIKQGRIYFKGVGQIDKHNKRMPDESTVFELASVSKLFTTETLQLLVDKGVVSMGDSIGNILGADQVCKDASNVTLLQLATHTSGFPNLPTFFLERMSDGSNPYKSLKTEYIYQYLKTCPEKKPAGDMLYSNFGMGLLGYLLSVKTGVKYEELVKHTLLIPLGMSHTFITYPEHRSVSIAQGYDVQGNPAPVWEDTVLTGAGSFLSNTSDMICFIRAHIENGLGVKASLRKTLMPQGSGETGLGWILPDGIDKFLGLGNMIWHNGLSGGYSSFLSIDTISKTGVIILVNKATDITNLGRNITRLVKTQSWD